MVFEIAQNDDRRMDRNIDPATQWSAAPRRRAALLTLLTTFTIVACVQAPARTQAPPPPDAPTAAPVAQAEAAAWARRPSYTGTTAAAEEAYQYALQHPDILRYIPCYCGCGAMGHRSNLDCYIKPTADGSIVFEEHASFCDICVQITLRTKQLLAGGASLFEARVAIDAEFGGTVPSTDTELPSA